MSVPQVCPIIEPGCYKLCYVHSVAQWQIEGHYVHYPLPLNLTNHDPLYSTISAMETAFGSGTLHAAS